MKKIKLIGAGQLGSRHLQALKAVQFPLEIEVIDPSIESLQVAKERYEAITAPDCNHKICFNQTLELPSLIDVAIVATSAGQRRTAIEMILQNSEVKHFVLEKLLFDKANDYDWLSERLQSTGSQAWVNCCMRMMPFYQSLQDRFHGQAISYQVTGSQYGLVTNAIHYLDHMVYLTGDNRFSIDTSYLDPKPVASKRKGYLELNGSLMARFARGSMGIINCLVRGNLPVQIEIFNETQRIISREWQQKAWVATEQSDWLWQEIDAKILFQSEMTAQLVTQLLALDCCDLPKYEESKAIHLQLLKPLQLFLQNNCDPSQTNYPFT